MVFKTIKFDDNWTYGPYGENVIFKATKPNATVWVMAENLDGSNVVHDFTFAEGGAVVGVSFYKNLVVIPQSNKNITWP
jgi:hypothetical protein